MKTILKTSVAAAALVAFSAPGMAADDSLSSGQPKVKLKIYGQVNKQVMWGDDGQTSRTFIVDSETSSTRLGFLAEAPVNADFNFGAQLEMEWKSNAPGNGGVAINNGNYNNIALNPDNNSVNQTAFVERIAEVTMNHKRFGKVSLGQGVMASDGSAESNLGVTLAGGTLTANYLGSTVLYDKTAKAYTTTTLGSIMNINDPAGRDDRIRYDTPRFMGLGLATGFASGGKADVAATYVNKIGQFSIDARVGYHNQNSMNSTIDDEVAGSISVLHDSGLNAHFTASSRNMKTISGTSFKDGEHIGGGIGYIAKIFSVGPTKFTGDYYKAENMLRRASTATGGYESTSWGLSAQQDFSDIGSSVFLGYRNTSFDEPNDTTVRYDDVNFVVAGVRVTF